VLLIAQAAPSSRLASPVPKALWRTASAVRFPL
jgi:hypothetical protein